MPPDCPSQETFQTAKTAPRLPKRAPRRPKRAPKRAPQEGPEKAQCMEFLITRRRRGNRRRRRTRRRTNRNGRTGRGEGEYEERKEQEDAEKDNGKEGGEGWEQNEEEEQREGGGVHSPTMQKNSAAKVQDMHPLVPSWWRGVTKSAPGGPASIHIVVFIPCLCGSALARART